VEGLAGTGFAVRTGTDTWATRSLSAGTGISISNADGVAGAPSIALGTVGTAGTYRSVTTDAQGRVTAGTNPTTLSGYGITDAQPLDADLTAIAAFASTGIAVRTATDTWAQRTLTAPAAGLTITNPAGVAGNPTFALANDLSALEGLASTGFAVRTATDTWAQRSIAVGSGLSVSNGDGVAGNPTISLSGLNSAATGTLSSWTLVSGSRYYSDFAHNLGTNNVVITLYDTNDNSVVTADSVILTSTNNVRVTVIGNTRTLRIVVVANGLAINTATPSAGTITTQVDSVNVSTSSGTLNFTGNVSATDAGGGVTTVMIGARYTFFANAFDTPNSSDWALNALAPTVADPSFASLSVRQFSNTTEQGVGFLLSIPTGATSITFKFRGRPASAPGVASVVQPRVYIRAIPNGSAMGAWSAAQNLSNISIPTTANFLYSNQTVTLASLSLTAGNMYQIELTRNIAPSSGTNLAANFLLAELTVELS
jgi:hypothetical protein